MVVYAEEKRRIIDLQFNQGKTIREVCRIMGKSSHDITPVTKMHRIRLLHDCDLANGEQSDVIHHEQEIVIPNVKAYKLFDEGKSPFEVSSELNLPGPQVQQYYGEYWNLRRMHRLVAIYPEIQDTMGYYLKLFRLGKEKGVTPEQIMNLVQMADSIHKLQDKLQQLQSEVQDISGRISAGKEQLENLHMEIDAAQEKSSLANKTFNVKYEELKEVCSQAEKLQHYVKEFKEDQDFQELESKIRIEVGKSVSDNKQLLQNALFSVLLALRNDPDRYLIVDKMELTPFITTILNCNSFLGSRRPPGLQGSEQFISGGLLVVAGRIFSNLQKVMVDTTISTAAGLEDGGSHATAYRALQYYEFPSQLSTEQS